jgi:NADH-quinone oxidoreductase subunit F
VCPELSSYYIRPDRCQRGCEHCLLKCPSKAISADEKNIKVIDQDKCVKCRICLDVCPPEYQAVIKVSPRLPEAPAPEKEAP